MTFSPSLSHANNARVSTLHDLPPPLRMPRSHPSPAVVLPRDVTGQDVASFLDWQSICALACVCKATAVLAQAGVAPLLWSERVHVVLVGLACVLWWDGPDTRLPISSVLGPPWRSLFAARWGEDATDTAAALADRYGWKHAFRQHHVRSLLPGALPISHLCPGTPP